MLLLLVIASLDANTQIRACESLTMNNAETPADEVLKAMENQAGKCKWCEDSLKGQERHLVHRIIPRFRGGEDRASNLEILCPSCHRDRCEMKVVAGKIPMHVHDELIEWKAEHMPNATMSEVVRFSIEQQVSDDIVQITSQSLSNFLLLKAEVDDLRAQMQQKDRQFVEALAALSLGDKNREVLPDYNPNWV